jgi:hypothetical protein
MSYLPPKLELQTDQNFNKENPQAEFMAKDFKCMFKIEVLEFIMGRVARKVCGKKT